MIYQPTHEDLLKMGFSPQEWEGEIYGYVFESLKYNTKSTSFGNFMYGTNNSRKYPFWTLGSWYHPWNPESREQVEAIISGFKKPLCTI